MMKNDIPINLSLKKLFKDSGLLKVEMPNYNAMGNKWHRHEDFYELVIVCSGSAILETGIESERVHAGNVFLFPDQTVHRYAEIKNFRHYNVLFHPSLLDSGKAEIDLKNLPGYGNLFGFMNNGENRHSKLNSVDDEAQAKLIPVLETIRNETTLWLPGWRENAYFEFMRMMVFLLRSCVPTDRVSDPNLFQIGQVIRMLEKDCTKKYTLKQMAETVNMSPSCFRHHFTEITGIPPGEYLMNLRLRKAVLLLNFPNSIEETATLCGIPDSNYFARLIRKRTGFSPKEIQRKYFVQELTVDELLDRLTPAGKK